MSNLLSPLASDIQITLDKLLARLEFKSSKGWVKAEEFNRINGPSGTLRRARDNMSVYGAFGTWQYAAKGDSKRFIPLAYIATAENDEVARAEVHRRIWSQGLVPLSLICTPTKVILCEGYSFSSEDWHKNTKQFSIADLDNNNPIDLDRLHTKNLLSSLSWRDFSINPHDRVDKRLLATLEAMSRVLVMKSNASIRVANSLIGRFIYFYMLLDRNLISQKWLHQISAGEIFDTRSAKMTTKIVWAVFDELDRLLNGSIFPLSKKERKCFTENDLSLLRDCIKFGDVLSRDGVQLSFIDFDFSSIQTETLSAIYEQFLETEDSEDKRKSGAFYTPPFLADFLLDRVEDEEPLRPDMRIIDCTAGSGVFVVGAFRRLIEQLLIRSGFSVLPANLIRELLLNSIFAIEKNSSAQAVMKFSLYLTMLDYVQQKDIDLCLDGKADQQLFPSLADNIVCMDVFSKSAQKWASKFHILIGNPPWQKLEQITTNVSEIRNRFGKFVDSDEASEYTLWQGLKHFVAEKGLVALVLPTKSFVGPSANRFPQNLALKTEIVGLANFSNLRYELFSHARQAAATILLRNNLPNHKSTFWTFSPTKAHLPGPIKTNPWLISFDRSQVERFNQRELSNNRSTWFELLMLRPIDRYIQRYIQDSIAVGNVNFLRKLFESEGVEINRGGSPLQTGLPSEVLYGADKFKSNDFRYAPGISLIGNHESFSLFSDKKSDFSWIENVNKNFKRRFEGNMLIVPRSMQGIAYASQPFAFNSSLNAFYFKEPALNKHQEKVRANFLKFIGMFLQSELAMYLFAITGSLWILDHTRLEKSDLLELPIPIRTIEDDFITIYLSANDSERTELLCKKMGLDVWFIKVINEYNKFRIDYEDGGIPTTFHNIPSQTDIDLYKSTLQLAVRPISDGLVLPKVDIDYPVDKGDPYLISIILSNNDHQDRNIHKYARENWVDSGIADFSDSTSLVAHNNDALITLQKPAEKFHWTMESAFTDGSILMQRLLEESHG